MDAPWRPEGTGTLAISKADFLQEFEHLMELEAQGLPLGDWYAQSAALQDRVLEDKQLTRQIPQLVWNYLTDFDVRALDPDYAREQQRDLAQALETLRRK
jgi:hypothetical protein